MVATVSLGSHIVLDVKPKDPNANEGCCWRVLQERRSLLITTSQFYTACLHGIDEVKIDEGLDSYGIVNWPLLGDKEVFKDGHAVRQPRISLTFRDVVKVKRLGKALRAFDR